MKKYNITKVTLIMLILVLSLVGFAGCKHEDDENIDTDVPETEEPVAPEVTEDIVIPDDVVETSSLDIDSMSQEEVANAYYTALISGDYDTAYTQVPHSPDMTTGVSPAVYEQIMTGLIASTGEFKELISYDVLEDPGYMIYEFHTQFENMPLTLRVVMIDKVVYGFNYAEYVPDEDVSNEPFTYEEREVTFGDTAYPLSGTLTIPNNLETYPIVILVQGSGPNDRDETIGPNKPFQDIAMALADAGIASLRYDKRTFTYGQELMTDTTLTVYDETIDDVILAVDFLRNNEAVLYNQLYVAGHSLGGYVIPRINQLTDNVTGYIMLAANARPLEELVPIQLEYVKGTMTSISSEEQAYFDAIYADLALLEDLDGLSNSQAVMGAYKAYWTDLATYEPLVLVQDIEVPLLILQGERDYQVTMTDFNLWQEALVDKPNVSFISFEKLNHLLMAGEGPSTPTEYTIPNHVDLALINEIVSFIKNN